MKILISAKENSYESSFLAQKIGAEIIYFDIRDYTGKEKFIKFQKKIPQNSQIHIFHKLWPEPNDKLIELLLIFDHIKSISASVESLVIPYIPYLRQDRELSENSCIGARLMGEICKSYNIKKIYTVDAHSEAAIKFFGGNLYSINPVDIFIKKIFNSEARGAYSTKVEHDESSKNQLDHLKMDNLSIISSSRLNQTIDFNSEARGAYSIIGEHDESSKNQLDHLKMELDIRDFLVLSPDLGSSIKGIELAKKLDLKFCCVEKVRDGDDVWAFGFEGGEFGGIIIIDDMIDSGRTIIASLNEANILERDNLLGCGALRVIICTSHILSLEGVERIRDYYSNVEFISSTFGLDYLEEIGYMLSTES